MNHPIPSRPWSKLAIDLFVYNSVNYVVLVGYFSDFWEAAKLNNTMPTSIIEFYNNSFHVMVFLIFHFLIMVPNSKILSLPNLLELGNLLMSRRPRTTYNQMEKYNLPLKL